MVGNKQSWFPLTHTPTIQHAPLQDKPKKSEKKWLEVLLDQLAIVSMVILSVKYYLASKT